MKRITITSFTILLCLSLTACFKQILKEVVAEDKAEFETVSINGIYSMGIPTFMSKATSLNEEASLQYQNIFKEAYVIVIDEDKQEFLDALSEVGAYDSARSVIGNYADTQMQLTSSGMNVKFKKDITELTINGLSAATTEVDAEVEGVAVPITYFLTFVEGPEKLYMVMAWTLSENKDTHRETFMEMAKSFKDLKTAPVASN